MAGLTWTSLRGLFVRNPHLKLIALLLTLAMYVWVSIDREVEVTRIAPIRLDVPESMVLTETSSDRARVTIRGKWSDINRFDRANLDPLHLALEASQPVGVAPLVRDRIDLPPGLRVVDIEPSFVKYSLAARMRKTVPIRPKITGEPAEGFELVDVAIDPARIELSGPATSLESVESIQTEPVDLSGRTGSLRRTVRLRLDDPLISYDLDRPIEVLARVESQDIQRTLDGLPVEAVNLPASLSAEVSPGSVSLTLRGPKAVVERLTANTLLAALDMSDRQAGTFVAKVRVRNIPDSVTILQTQPTYFKVVLTDETP